MDTKDLAQKHSDLLYDYIKFHLELYVATPPVLAIVATGLGVNDDKWFQRGMILMLVVYFIAAAHACRTIAGRINIRWESEADWAKFGEQAHSRGRRIMHHHLYWAGLVACLGPILIAWL